MPNIEFEGASYALREGESVLEALLRNGKNISHSCKAGVCGSCLMRVAAGPIPAAAQAGMKETWKAQGFMLACACRPEGDLRVETAGQDVRVPATITALDLIGANVMRARLHCSRPLDFRAGQYVTVLRRDGLARSYSIASLPEHGDLELHVRRIEGGRMSMWLHSEAQTGEQVEVAGPSGQCFYVPGNEDQPLLLAGTGTGLAPLYGILRDALKNGHRGPVHLYHGALHEGGLYLTDELRAMEEEYPQFRYIPTVMHGDETGELAVGPIDQIIMQRAPKLKGWRGFVCGDPGIVQSLKKKLFLGGMASRDIYADAFIPAAPAS